MVDAQTPDPRAPKASSNQSDLLRKVLDHLVARVRREQLETWFRSLNVERADEAEVELSVTSQFVRDWLAKNYHAVLQDAVDALAKDMPGNTRRRLVLTHREEDGLDSLRLVQPSPAEEIERLMQLQEGGPISRQHTRTSQDAAPAAATGDMPSA